MTLFDDALRVLEGVRRNGDSATARCPVHEDRASSLSLKDAGPEKWPLCKCFAGCTFEAIREALEAKGIKREREYEKTEKTRERKPVKSTTRHELRDATDALQCYHVRLDFEDGSKSFYFEMPDGQRRLTIKGSRLLYGVELAAKHPGAAAVICEGEKAANALRAIGVKVTLGTVGASILPDEDVLNALRGREVYLWPDNDDHGRIQGDALAKRLAGRCSKLATIAWPDAPPKGDAADFVAAGGDLAAFRALAASAKASTPTLPPHVIGIGDARVVAAVLAREDGRFQTGRMPGAISTGWKALDHRLRGGWMQGQVYLLGATTGSGKTTALQAFAVRASESGPVLYVSPEMTVESLVEREITRRCRIPEYAAAARPDHYRDDEPKRRDLANVRTDEGARLMRSPPQVLIYDRADATMEDIVETARALPGLVLVVIDYAQQVADLNDKPRYLQVGDVANRSVTLAKELGIPVLIASQVNVSEDRKGNRTYTYREAQILEHKASWAAIMERTDPAEEWGKAIPYAQSVPAKLVLRKNRDGPAFGEIELEWWPALYAIEEKRAPIPESTDQWTGRADLRDD